MSDLQIPSFLDRRKTVTNQPLGASQPIAVPATPKRERREDCYIANVKIIIPINVADAETLSRAIAAVAGLREHLPTEALIKIDAKLGRV